jgi:catechol 2,3-dioxygenase-like lactoylglutathione lyase family enzyme
MLDHVSLGVSDLELSRRFYDAALKPLGLRGLLISPDVDRITVRRRA